MNTSCGCCSPVTMFLACSGASDVGELADRSARALTGEGAGKMSCLAGVAAGVSGMVKSAAVAQPLVMIDGCKVACGRQCLERAGFSNVVYVQLEAMGYTKGKTAVRAETVAEVVAKSRALAVTAQPARGAVPFIDLARDRCRFGLTRGNISIILEIWKH